MKKTKIRILWSAAGVTAAMLAILAVRTVQSSSREAAEEVRAAASQTTGGGLRADARNAGARNKGSGISGDMLAASPDGRFHAEGAFLATPNREGFRLKPFAVAQQSESFAWTAEDGKSAEAMRQLAHTDEEEDRLQTENQWVEKRQLVYCDDYIAELGKAVASEGSKLKSAKLPGFDGTEYEVDVLRVESPQGAMEWNVSGRLKDRPDTVISLSTVHGYTSFAIISPEFYIEGDAREPGEVVVNRIDRQARRNAKPQGPVETVSPFRVGEPAAPAQ